MFSATIQLLVRNALAFCQRIEQALIAVGAERRCAQRLDGISERLLRLGYKISVLRACMQAGRVSEAMDADLSFREALAMLKKDVREIRRQLAFMNNTVPAARLQRAFQRLSAIAEETYSSADKLQWEIDEHDQHYLH